MRKVDFNEETGTDVAVKEDTAVAKSGSATWGELREELEASMSRTAYMRFNTETGEFQAGKDKSAVDFKSGFILIPSFMKKKTVFEDLSGKGFVKRGQKPVESKRKLLFSGDSSDIETPYDGKDGYIIIEGYEFVVKLDDSGEEYWFSAGNMTTMNAVKNLLREIFVEIPSTDEPPLTTPHIPRVEVEIGEFVNSYEKKQKSLTFNIVDWTTADGVGEFRTIVRE